MKRIIAILLCVLLCASLAGCRTDSDYSDSSLSLVSDKQPSPTASSVPDTTGAEEDRSSNPTEDPTVTTAPDTSVASKAEDPTTPSSRPSNDESNPGNKQEHSTSGTEPFEETSPTQPTTPPNTGNSSTSDTGNNSGSTDITTPHATEAPTDPTSPTENTTPPETNASNDEEESKETEPPTETEPQPPADPYAYPFDMEQIRRDCIALGKGYGFTLNESLTPSNSSWAGAETASSNTQGNRLKRLLTEMVEYYSPAYREEMGLPAVNITAFNIYCESTGNGNYRIYFLFLL